MEAKQKVLADGFKLIFHRESEELCLRIGCWGDRTEAHQERRPSERFSRFASQGTLGNGLK